MEIHHDKHHQTYVTNLNAAVDKHESLKGKSLVDLITNLNALPEDVRTAIRNNGGGHYNHSMFWEIMGPRNNGAPEGDLAKNIDAEFGGFDQFKTLVNQAGAGRFGSGWAWLSVDSGGKLQVESTPNQDCPISEGRFPILGVDVWEHAYYLLYQNRRPDYLAAWWNTVNWEAVSKRYASRGK